MKWIAINHAEKVKQMVLDQTELLLREAK